MSAAPAEVLSLRRFGDDQIVTLAKLVIENALQPIVEATTGAVFGYESLMRGFDRPSIPISSRWAASGGPPRRSTAS